ncbi:MAG: MGMT family protein [Patescibacteria group bacterium]|nr:MGMT family protein [Patescibacteria group bacterium]
MKKKFKDRVYEVVRKIPRGNVLSYQKVAQKAGNPKAYRAVGNILNQHNLKGLLCHRVVKSNGEVGGYRWGKKRKTFLLKKEGIKIDNRRFIVE